jgi:hypothetical protein
MKVKKVDTWVAAMKDTPGALAAKLKELSSAGASLEFVIARRAPDKPGTGVVFVIPIKGARQVRAARLAGFHKAKSLHTIRIEGPDRKGQGAKITAALAANGINLHGLSAAAIGKVFVSHVAVDTTADANKTVKILKAL